MLPKISSLLLLSSVGVILLFSAATPTSGAILTRNRRQLPPPSPTPAANLTEILSALNLTSYLQSATPQIQASIQQLALAFQNGTNGLQPALASALQNVSLQGQNVTQGIQAFLTNLQTALTLGQPNISSSLNQTLLSGIASLQHFYASNGPALQKLTNQFGANVTAAAGNLQTQMGSLANFLQSGLSQLANSNSWNTALLQNIKSLNQSIHSGVLNQTLASIVTNFQGQAITFQQALTKLPQQGTNLSTPLQTIITCIQTGLQAFLNSLRNVFNTFIGFLSPITTTNTNQPTIVIG